MRPDPHPPSPRRPGAFQRFANELRRRHVPQTAAVYLVSAWAAIQFADVVVPNVDGPQWIVTAVIIAAGVGLPVVLVLAWLLEWGPEGVHRTAPAEVDADADTARAGAPGAAPDRSAPWAAAVAVLLVAIGSGLGVAVLVQGAGDGPVDPGPGASGGRHPEIPQPPELVVPGANLEAQVRAALEMAEEVKGLGALDSLDLAELGEIGTLFGDRSLIFTRPQVWTYGPAPAPLAEGDTLLIEGAARDSAGVVSVSVDGVVVEEVDRPVPVLPFEAAIVGTGAGSRTISIVIRTADGREVRREYRTMGVQRRGEGSAPPSPDTGGSEP